MELDAGFFRRGDDLLDPVEAVVHRFLHKHVLARLGHFDGVLRVEISGRADHRSLDLRVIQNHIRVLNDIGDPQTPQKLHRFFAHVWVSDGLDLHFRNEFGDIFRMNTADAARSNDTDFDGFHNVFSSLSPP